MREANAALPNLSKQRLIPSLACFRDGALEIECEGKSGKPKLQWLPPEQMGDAGMIDGAAGLFRFGKRIRSRWFTVKTEKDWKVAMRPKSKTRQP